jgi:hypothetical membrane protein
VHGDGPPLFPNWEVFWKGTLMAHTSQPTPTADQSDTSAFGPWKGLQSPLTLALVSCGGIGALLFTVTYLIEGVTQPGYNAWQHAISALSLGPGGWVQQVNFIVYGVLLVLASVGWYRLLLPGRTAIWFPLFQGIGGLGLIGVGVFTSGTLHTLLAYALIYALAIGCFALAPRFWVERHWRWWAVYSCSTGVLILIFWGMFIQGANGNVAGLTPLAGLIERLSAGSHALWLCVLTATLLAQHQSRSS